MSNASYSHRLIILAEDDEDDQEFIRAAIMKIDPQQVLHVASNGKELMDYINNLQENQLPCLIVIDLNMPVMDGWQTLEALNRLPRFKKVPKVIFTTSDVQHHRDKALENGAAEFLTKPHNMTEVVNSMSRILSYCH